MARHGGRVPSSFEALEALPGVGHKTASVVMAQAFGVPAFPVDTHIWRLALRWGLSAPGANVVAVERDLKALYPPERWGDLHLQLIFFGREHCPAQRHDAAACPVCSWAAAEAATDGAAEPAVLATPTKGKGAKATSAPGSGGKRAPQTPGAAAPNKRARKALDASA